MMKSTLQRWRSILALSVLAVSVFAAGPVETAKITLVPGSRLWIEGDSTAHAYESYANSIELDSEVVFKDGTAGLQAADFVKNPEQAPTLNRLVLLIPVEEMKSHIIGLASQLHSALKYKKNPNIVFQMESYRVSKVEAQTNGYAIAADGNLEVAGKTNRITVTMAAVMDNQKLNLKGEQPLLMSDYGVKAPEMFFGTLKVADKIVIKWDLNIELTSTQRRDEPIAETQTP